MYTFIDKIHTLGPICINLCLWCYSYSFSITVKLWQYIQPHINVYKPRCFFVGENTIVVVPFYYLFTFHGLLLQCDQVATKERLSTNHGKVNSDVTINTKLYLRNIDCWLLEHNNISVNVWRQRYIKLSQCHYLSVRRCPFYPNVSVSLSVRFCLGYISALTFSLVYIYIYCI